MEEYISSYPEYARKANSKVKMILLVLVIIAALISVSALAVINFFPEVIFSLMPKNMYLLVENQAKEKLEKQIGDSFKDGFVQDSIKAFNNPHKSQSEVSAKLKTDKLTGSLAEQFNSANEIISSSKLTFTRAADYEKEQVSNSLSLMVKGNDLLQAELFLDKEKAGFGIPKIYNKYFTVNTDNLSPLMETLGQTNGLKKFPTDVDIIKAIKFDKKELENVAKDYAKFYADYISDRDVTFTKGVEIDTTEGKIKCNQITLKFDKERLKDFEIKLAEKATNDDRLLNLTVGNYINVVKLFEESGLFDAYGGLPEEQKDMNSMKKKFEEEIKKFKNDPNNSNTEMVMTLLIDRNFNVLERKVQLIQNDDNNDNTTSFRLASYKLPKSKANNSIFQVMFDNRKDTSKNGGIKLTNLETAVAKGKSTRKITYDVIGIRDGEENKIASAVYDININEIKDKHKEITVNYDATIKSGFIETEESKLTGKLLMSLDRDPAQKAINSKINADYDIKIPGQGIQGNDEFGIIYSINNNTKYDVPVELPKLESSNTVDLNTASLDELKNEFQTIQMKVEAFVIQYAELFNINPAQFMNPTQVQ